LNKLNTENTISNNVMELNDHGKFKKTRKIKLILSFLLLSLFFWSCSAKVLPPPEWIYEKNAISLHIEADHELNLDDGESHTLHLCVYQLKDPNGFNQLSADLNGLYELLDCSMFDTSVAVLKQITVHPGETIELKLDRAESAKYLAVVAGYHVEMSKNTITRLIEIPVVIKKEGFIRKSKTQVPGLLNTTLYLGPMQIKGIENLKNIKN